MKTFLLYILVIIILLAGGFIYLQVGGGSVSPFRTQAENGSPTITTGQSDSEQLKFRNYGTAPEVNAKTVKWLNGEPQTMANLKGKVVLVNFWTYSCINCIRSLPYLEKLYQDYSNQGLVVLGIHTPQYAFEKVTENVLTAIQRYNIHYPIIQDNSYAVWNAYNNQFWPAVYLVDRDGKIVYTRLGEANYDLTENAIRQLVGLPTGIASANLEDIPLSPRPSQKLLFGLKNPDSVQSNEKPSGEEQVYTLPEQLRRNSFALEGVWKLANEKASLTQGYGRVRLNFTAAEVKLTAQSIKPVTLKINIDGKELGEVTVQALQDYELFKADQSAKHILDIEIPQPGFEAMAFIFD